MRTAAVLGVVLALAGWGTAAFGGGDEMGNGGHIVECRSPGSVSYQTLDAYEAEHAHQRYPDLTTNSEDEFARAAMVLVRLEKLDPERMKRYLRILEFLNRTHKFITGARLTVTHDSANPSLPANCTLLQAVIQLQKPVDGPAFFLVSKSSWTALDDANRIILLLHEVIYWDAIRYYGHRDSVATRRFNMALFSNEFSEMDQQSYQRFLETLHLDAITYESTSQRLSWALSKEDLKSQDAAEVFCAKRGMHLLTWSEVASEFIDDFRNSALGQYHIAGRGITYLWLNERGKIASIEGDTQRVMTGDQKSAWSLCVRKNKSTGGK